MFDIANLRRATDDEIRHWHELIATNPAGGDVLQTQAFAAVKAQYGWRPEFWVYETSFGPVYALFLTKNIPRVGRVIYVPRGPSVNNIKEWREICRLNRKHLHATLVRMEPPILKTAVRILPNNLVKVDNIQKHLSSTVILNLNQDETSLLASFRQRARRSIRGGKREKLRVVNAGFSAQSVNQMWRLYKETARRASLRIRPKSYYRRFWRRFCEQDLGRFFFVMAPGESAPIAGAFVCIIGSYALYKDGGSRRDVDAHFSHLLHWRIMQWLRARNVTRYDLDGTPPSDRLHDTTHRLYSIGIFKTSFGAPVVDYVGAYDQILHYQDYKRWLRVEKISQTILNHTPRRGLY